MTLCQHTYEAVHEILVRIANVRNKVSEYGQEMTQSHTTDQPMAPLGRVKER